MKLWNIETSKTELIDITKAWLALSLAFAFLLFPTGISLFNGFSFNKLFSFEFLWIFVISFFTVGIGFLLHELAHKFVAQRYGCAAEFRAWDQFLYLAVGLAVLVGFTFAAPGAVMISGMVTRKENGLISAAGPLTNYVLGLVFLVFLYIFPAWKSVFLVGFHINLLLGLFNLIPFGPLDGAKVFHWSKSIWGVLFVIGVFLKYALPGLIFG